MHSLMYHDVYPDSASHRVSGFADDTAAVYKLPLASFQAHLDRLAENLVSPPVLMTHAYGPSSPPPRHSWTITFDDGGMSAYDHIAPALERLGWRGHFFVTTSRIGTEGFLSGDQIRELHQRGHLIGAHSHTHPPRISTLSRDKILEEWTLSLNCLGDITGTPVTAASVPGGFFSRAVAEAAASAGIRFLFNSEPSPATVALGRSDCLVLGRYSIKRDTPPLIASALATGAFPPRLRMQVGWQVRRFANYSIGSFYETIRRKLLVRRNFDK
jgi:peptidoglycan/xylan/chitin deacetylase (PgdA/CDA1 family)